MTNNQPNNHQSIRFQSKDAMQIVVGAALLAIPIGFTEETWRLGEHLPTLNILIITVLSIVFITVFVFFNYKRGELKHHHTEFVKRVAATYVLAFLVVGLFMTLIQQAPWILDTTLAIKRILIVTFPASMSAVIADMLNEL
ncbi:MAG: DUF2391 domain-containing protein [Candidatus Buchananbacteria bacterium CG10_big_fil_rev_8_21_14_0_10_42_9]|uniref:DUF2391 domain-containing protein n=1 Tax=Candidatus Buchananbacteria bacterium CG10_big_fil_rev_8_21_14_0_10_42_9 TaxID=1974526 RepID=A0A2H0W3I9_9BACT|nr:MAG: DUF2391 domain-containing protein [Candidatus Buchananbacteria bacterium CG10_big_fil_rev_8_21_14_0_10_42_9]